MNVPDGFFKFYSNVGSTNSFITRWITSLISFIFHTNYRILHAFLKDITIIILRIVYTLVYI